MQPGSIQLSLSQAKADPSIAWSRFSFTSFIVEIQIMFFTDQKQFEKGQISRYFVRIEAHFFLVSQSFPVDYSEDLLGKKIASKSFFHKETKYNYIYFLFVCFVL